MMGLVLKVVRDHLMELYGWDHTVCGVHMQAHPPATCGQWFIALDDGGIQQVASEKEAWMKERAMFVVAVWRRCGEIPTDKSGDMLLWHPIYRDFGNSLEQLERQVLQGIAGDRYVLLSEIRTLTQCDPGKYGDCPSMPPRYLGRGPTEFLTLPDQQANREQNAFVGRRLRFSGFDRTQSLDSPKFR